MSYMVALAGMARDAARPLVMLSSLSLGSSSRSPQMHPSASPLSPNTPHSAIFSGIDDELRDARRVYSQGQEEDLRYALERVITRVEELVSSTYLLSTNI